MKTKLPHIEVILPVFNERENLEPLVRALDGAAAKLKGTATMSYLFVNDGSSDGTTEELYRLHESRPDVRVVDLLHNFGHGAALSAGVDHFKGDIAVVMDADLQDDPDSIADMLEEWKKGSRTVVAERGERKERNSWAFRSFYFLLHKVARQLPPIDFGTHCLLDASVIERLRQLPEKNRYFPGLVSYSSGAIKPLPFARGARAHGESRVGTMGLINLALTACLSFSNAPVRLVSALGLLCAVVATGIGIGIMGVKLFTDRAIPGWASIMTTAMLGNGVQLFCLGLIGEYVARIYDEVKQRPVYFVHRVLEREKAKKGAAA